MGSSRNSPISSRDLQRRGMYMHNNTSHTHSKESQQIFKMATKLITRKKGRGIFDPSNAYVYIAPRRQVIWLTDDVKFPRRICEMERLIKNTRALEKLEKSPNVSDFTKRCWIAPYQRFLKNALKIYYNHQEEVSLENRIAEVNDHIESHIVIRMERVPHRTFRVCVGSEAQKRQMSEEDLIAERLQDIYDLNIQMERLLATKGKKQSKSAEKAD